MKILFLDIDGVLTTRRSLSPTSCSFDAEAVEQLNRVLKAIPSLQIVISSSWRLLHTMEELKAIFCQYGVTPGRVLGKTPVLADKERGDEIKAWLEMTALWYRGNLEFAIVDDDSDMGELIDHLFHTTFDHGLTKEVADRLIKRFGGKCSN